MDTGSKDSSKYGMLHNSVKCSEKETSASFGDIFLPVKDKTIPLKIFFSEFCNNFDLYFEKEQKALGINGFKFSARRDSLNSKCSCTSDCLPLGVQNVSVNHPGSSINGVTQNWYFFIILYGVSRLAKLKPP